MSISLVWNKIEINDRKISKEVASEFTIKNGLFYYEISSKDGINIDRPFENLAKDIKENIDNEPNETVEQKLERIKERNIFERKREKEVKCC